MSYSLLEAELALATGSLRIEQNFCSGELACGTGSARQVCQRAKPVKGGSAQVHLAALSQSSSRNYG
jgi:hypothetical protein